MKKKVTSKVKVLEGDALQYALSFSLLTPVPVFVTASLPCLSVLRFLPMCRGKTAVSCLRADGLP